MELIANYWWIWLALVVASGGYAVYNQLQRIKSIGNIADGVVTGVLAGMSDPEKTYDSVKKVAREVKGFWTGILAFAIAVVISAIGGFLLLISVIINLVNYLK